MSNRSGSRAHLLIYYSLFVILGLSFGSFVYGLINQEFFTIVKHVYFYILLGYVWYIFILLFLGDIGKDVYPDYDNGKIAVIIPVYNEDEELFLRCLRSVKRCSGDKTILVVDDGSTRGMDKDKLRRICERNGILIHFFEKNLGKRHVLHYATKRLASSHDYVVTIDSDTILDKDALVRIVAPLQLPWIGATTGNVLLLNEHDNYLTRMVGAYYWIGLDIFKKAQSTFGFVVCCSGCIAGYKSEIIASIIDEFVEQKFLGEDCTHSEDRHLTNLTLRDGWDVKYVPEAVSHTYTPNTIVGFLKQQQRWKRGYIRESTFTLTYAWKTRKLLFIESFFCELTIPFVAFGLMISLIGTIFTQPIMFLTRILPFWLLFMVVRYSPIFFNAPKKSPGLLIYAIFYDLFLYWQCIYALFTVKNKSWITRG